MARYFAMANGVWDKALKLAKKTVRRCQSSMQSRASLTLAAPQVCPLAPYRQLQDAFVLSLRQFSCFDRMLPFFRAVPASADRVVSGGATAATVDEAAPVPLASLQFTLSQIGAKTICIAEITAEVMREASSDELMKELVRATVAEIDRAFIAKITAGLSVTPSNGGTSVAILQDLAAALAGLTLGATSKVFIVVSSDIAKHWSISNDLDRRTALSGADDADWRHGAGL